MTFGVLNVIGVARVRNGGKPISGPIVPGFNSWPASLQSLWGMVVQCHLGHAVELAVAVGFYLTLWPVLLAEAASFSPVWIAKVVAFHLACEFACFGFWHAMTYAGRTANGPMKKYKYNKENQYEPDGATPVGFLTSSTGHLNREVFFTTLGWLMSSLYTVVALHLYATHSVRWYANFWDYPIYSVAWILAGTYWREFHFYWVHRMIHPWSERVAHKYAWWDLGALLYK